LVRALVGIPWVGGVVTKAAFILLKFFCETAGNSYARQTVLHHKSLCTAFTTFANFGDGTQIGSFLFVLCRSIWLRQVGLRRKVIITSAKIAMETYMIMT